MTIITGIVLYYIIWFMCLFVILPLRLTTQQEDSDIVPGSPPSAPASLSLWRRAFWVTVLATIVFIPIAATIHFGWITHEDLSIFLRKD